MPRALDIGTEEATFPGDPQRLRKGLPGMRIFGAAIDIALGGADADAANRHAFDQGEGIALHDHPIGESAAVAFVGVAHHIFAVSRRIGDGLPFDAGRKTGAAAAAKPGFRHFGNDRLRADCDGLCKPAPAAMRGVIGKRERIGDAAAGEGEARLGCKERMRAAGDKARLKVGSDIGG
jgi:hypothetical protein